MPTAPLFALNMPIHTPICTPINTSLHLQSNRKFLATTVVLMAAIPATIGPFTLLANVSNTNTGAHTNKSSSNTSIPNSTSIPISVPMETLYPAKQKSLPSDPETIMIITGKLKRASFSQTITNRSSPPFF